MRRDRASGGKSHSKLHPDDIIARAEGEEDLDGRGKQRHDPHHPMLRPTTRTQPSVAVCVA